MPFVCGTMDVVGVDVVHRITWRGKKVTLAKEDVQSINDVPYVHMSAEPLARNLLGVGNAVKRSRGFTLLYAYRNEVAFADYKSRAEATTAGGSVPDVRKNKRVKRMQIGCARESMDVVTTTFPDMTLDGSFVSGATVRFKRPVLPGDSLWVALPDIQFVANVIGRMGLTAQTWDETDDTLPKGCRWAKARQRYVFRAKDTTTYKTFTVVGRTREEARAAGIRWWNGEGDDEQVEDDDGGDGEWDDKEWAQWNRDNADDTQGDTCEDAAQVDEPTSNAAGSADGKWGSIFPSLP